VTDPRVVFMPSGRRARFAPGTNLLDAARSLGVYIESVCGGRGLCGRCQIEPAFGVFAKDALTSAAAHLGADSVTETPYRARGALGPARHLACACRIEGDLVIDVPPEFAVNRQVVRKRAEGRSIVPDPATRLLCVTVAGPDMANPTGDADRLLAALDIPGLTLDPALLASVQRTLRKGDWRVTAAIHADDAAPAVTALWSGERAKVFGVAFDVGSTTIAGHLVDLATARTVASAGTANPQIRFGEDLMSRVSFVMLNPSGAADLTRVVRQAISTLVNRLADQAGIDAGLIVEAAFVGNPVMHHLLLGIDPTELGQAPFALAVSGPLRLRAAELDGLGLVPSARVYLLPCIAGHVGADAAAVALADGPQHHDDVTLVVDVGTNAEILLGHRGRVLAASSPTGPAFEGAQISAGQRAAPGAIERVRVDRDTLAVRIKVLGTDPWSDEPGFAEGTAATGITGICGSGIIEAVAELFLAGVVAADGSIVDRNHPRVVADGRVRAFVLWDAIRVTQADIRAIQLAKAALYAGAKLLMDKLGVATVHRIKLAGAFGSYIDPLHAMVLGLIPDCDPARVTSIGNSAGTGARMALASRAHRREVEALVGTIEKIETAMEPRFQEHFVHAIALPNGADPFPHLAAAVQLPAQAAARPRRRLASQGNR